jgi:tRNA modification GTPase
VPAGEAPSGGPTVEVNCHGGVVAVQRVLACFVARGALAVEPEALLDREARTAIRAEAARALLQAGTSLGADTLLDQLNGALEDALSALSWERPEAAAAALRGLLATERLGRALWQPRRVVLVGPTNAGKSTLFNALAREERVIVSPIPGTTRDTVSAEVAIGGLPVWLVDTAGQREPACAIEREAIARARAAAAEADLALLVLDGSAPLSVPPADFAEALPPARVVVLNKSDLGIAPWAAAMADAVRCSAVTGQGIEALGERIVADLVGETRTVPGRAVVCTERQAVLLRAALEQLERGDAAAARERVRECVGAR